jgi:hypothetical protein
MLQGGNQMPQAGNQMKVAGIRETPFDRVNQAVMAVRQLRDRVADIVTHLAGSDDDDPTGEANPVPASKLHQVEHAADMIIAITSDANRILERLATLIGQ